MTRTTTGKNLQNIVTILLLLMLVLPVSVLADSPVDITTGATYSFPWNASVLKPGSSGAASINLINNGTLDGTLYVWVANISQTDAFGDGAALGRYMYFNVSNPRLVSQLPLPARIDTFPTAPMTGNYLVISPVRPGETLHLNWTWEFVESGQVQNDAQGDTLRFDINYMLVNGTLPLPTVTPTPPQGSGGGSGYHTFTGSGVIQTQMSMKSTPTEGITTPATPQPDNTQVPSPTNDRGTLFGPDSWFILVIIGLLILICVVIINSRR